MKIIGLFDAAKGLYFKQHVQDKMGIKSITSPIKTELHYFYMEVKL